MPSEPDEEQTAAAVAILDQEYGPSRHPADPGRKFTVTFTTAPYNMQVRELAKAIAARDARIRADALAEARQIVEPLRELEIPTPPAITDEEAREILSRFIASHFGDPQREHARITIPADPRRDDDLRLAAYIEQTAAPTTPLQAIKAARDLCTAGQLPEHQRDVLELLDQAIEILGDADR
jgi:hypothetical protein